MKNIKFHEAANPDHPARMKTNDTFQPHNTLYAGFILQNDGSFLSAFDGSEIKIISYHFNLVGKIIRAEPVVRTVDEIRTKVTHEDPYNKKPYSRLLYECAEYGIKEGKLERDIELRPLFLAVQEFYRDQKNGIDQQLLEQLFSAYLSTPLL